MNNFPSKIPVFPLSNFIMFPKTTVPLNIFEPRYIDMVNDAMKSNKFIGMVQPKTKKNDQSPPTVYEVGCLGKITSFNETDDGRYLIEVKGTLRFNIIEEIISDKKYREFNVDYSKFADDLSDKKEKWWTCKEFYYECDNLRDKFTNENDEKNLKFLDQLNNFVMSIEKKYQNV